MTRRIGAVLLLAAGMAWAHGGAFRGPGAGGVPPGLPQQPSSPARTGKVPHSWLTWWGYNQFNVLDFRRRQKARRGPVSGERRETDPDAWRGELRTKLVPILREALGDDDKEVRTAAAVALGKLAAHDAIEDLKRLYRDDNLKEVREAALQGLLLMGDAQLHDFFTGIIADQGEQLRLRGFALMGLGRIDDARSRQTLLGFFDRKNRRQRAQLPTSTGDRRQFLIAALIGLQMTGDKLLAGTFLEFAADKRLDEDVRAYAVNCVAKVGAVDRLPDVLEILARESNEQIRRSAAVAVGVLAPRGDAVAVKALARAVSKDKDKIVNHYATISLGQVGGDEAFKRLKRYHKYADKEGRGFFMLAYGFCGHADGAKILKREMETAADANDGAAAAMGLGILADAAQAPALKEKFEESKSWVLLQTTALALGMLNDTTSAEAIKTVLINKRHPPVKTAAAIAYALLHQHSAVGLFADLLKTSKTVYTRNVIAQIMGYLASPRAAEKLLEIYKDESLQRQTRAYALVGLGTLADTSDYPIFPALAFDTNYFVRCDPFDVVVTIL